MINITYKFDLNKKLNFMASQRVYAYRNTLLRQEWSQFASLFRPSVLCYNNDNDIIIVNDIILLLYIGLDVIKTRGRARGNKNAAASYTIKYESVV